MLAKLQQFGSIRSLNQQYNRGTTPSPILKKAAQLVIEMALKQKRLSLKGLSDFHYKWGKLWAFAKNRPLSKLIVDVFEARIEANRADIELMIRDIAEQRFEFHDLPRLSGS